MNTDIVRLAGGVMRGHVIGTLALVVVAAMTVAAFQDPTTPPAVGGMREADFIQINLAALQFYASLNVLILAGYGFVLGRAWPEGEPRPSLGRPWVFGFGVLLAVIAAGLIGLEYLDLGQAASKTTIGRYSAEWGGRLLAIMGFQAVSTFLIFVHRKG